MVNSFCTSGLTATAMGAARARPGDAGLVAVGGVECMSRVPMMSDKGPLAGGPKGASGIPFIPNPIIAGYVACRSEERRVGNRCVSRWSCRRRRKHVEKNKYKKKVTAK